MVGTDTGGDTCLQVLGLGNSLLGDVARVERCGDDDILSIVS